MIRYKTSRYHNGKKRSPGDPVEGSGVQKQRLLECGQAYDDTKDSAPEPSSYESAIPDMSNTKKEIEQYLDANDVEYDEYATKSELLDLI